jgi:Ca2+-binding RTX toxin-like protein
MTTIFSVTAALGTAVAILFAPAATADHNTTNQFEFSCINDVYCEGGPWDEKIIGDLRSQRIEGKGGADDVIGNRGIDWLDGGTGRDDVWGGEDDDRIYGDRGEDELHGGNDDDKVYAGCYGGCDQTGDNRDFLYGGTGDDIIGAENDKADTISCGSGFDEVWADPSDNVAAGCEVEH